MKNIKEKIQKALPEGIWVLDVKVDIERAYIRVIIDGEEHVTINDTTIISKRIKNINRINAFFSKGYNLEVTTPGLDQDLKYSFQYKKFLSKTFKVVSNSGFTKKQIIGKLIEVNKNGIKVNEKGDSINISYDDILSAKPKIEF